MTTPAPDVVVRIVDTYTATVAAVRARVADYVDRTFRNLGSYRDADINRFVAAVLPVVEGGQRQVASLTDAYLATIARQVLGTGKVTGVQTANVAALRGTDPAEVYARPIRTVWYALSKGASFNDAVEQGVTRATDLALTDLQLAKTHTARAAMLGDNRVVGYRRVLEGPHNCGLCIVASTQRYHRGDLMPIHPACDCGVLPIYGRHDIGQIIDEQSLDDVHAAIQERFGVSDRGARAPIDYRKVLLVRQHGELGPVLTVKGQHFDGPGDIAA